MSYSFIDNKLSYIEYLTAHDFVEDISHMANGASRRLAMDIPGQTLEIIASAEALKAEKILAKELPAKQISDSGELSSYIQKNFTRLSYNMQEISTAKSGPNATFHWGFCQMAASTERMNDPLAGLIKLDRSIIQLPARSAAYEQYETARDAFRKGLYPECLESLNRAIDGDNTSTGYKLEWRFHQMKGILLLGFVDGDISLVDFAAAEESFKLAARYAKSDYPEQAANALIFATWAAYCQGRMNEGLTCVEQALAIMPDLGEALFLAAKIHMALGEVDSAMPLLSKAIDVDRFYSLKAAGDIDFQRHDEKLRGFLEAMRKEKYRQAVPKILDGLDQLKRIFEKCMEDRVSKAIGKLDDFLSKGEAWPLLDMLAVVQRRNEIIAESKRLPITLTFDYSRTSEEDYQDQETYQEEVVIKPARLFRKAVTKLQTQTRMVTKKHETTNTASVTFEFCFVPAGTFLMGDNANGPVHKVTISKDYYLGKFPVTQSQWEAVMGNNSSKFTGENRPVENVSWDNCQQFIQRINASGKGTYRLPTEAEWEYACRAGSNGRFCFGDNENELDDYAWYSANSNNQTQPAGLKKSNAWGLHDMHGNVWEWCLDMYGDYPAVAVTDPQGPLSSSFRVYRGGSWRYDASHAQSAYRRWYDPGYHGNGLGFRLLSESI